MAILYWLDFWFFPTCTLALLEVVPYNRVSISFMFSGYLSWVLIEYALHRWAFHYKRSPFWLTHRQHHKEPLDEDGMPNPFTSWVYLGLTAYWAYTTFGHQLGPAWFTGLLLGYQSYIWTHHAIHVGWLSPSNPIRARHELHHKGWSFNYNLLCPLGDLVFGTYKRSVKK